MEQQYYTKEELELLNTPSASEALPPQPIHAAPESMGVTPEQQELMAKLQSTSTGVRSAGELTSAVFFIIFGLVFMIIPLSMGLTMALAMKATGDLDGGFWLVPLGMVSIFVLAGGAVVIKGVKKLVRYIKKKP